MVPGHIFAPSNLAVSQTVPGNDLGFRLHHAPFSVGSLHSLLILEAEGASQYGHRPLSGIWPEG